MRYVALLRGINVGGKNLIRMTDLKASFESHGFEDVSTYIQSGNVLFQAPRESSRALTLRIETLLTATFGTAATVVVRSHSQLRSVVESAPRGFGGRPRQYRYDVVFLKEPVTASAAVATIRTKPEVDQVWVGRGVLYFARLEARATQSRLNSIVASPIYPSITIRNWNTTTKLLALMDAAAADASKREGSGHRMRGKRVGEGRADATPRRTKGSP
ncbi:MAG TPA: DUF1697 domain-containing protein [Actinomycetota bacterium]|nr:DUF1697 domain-containing protein [Actinomycetota bacterium]